MKHLLARHAHHHLLVLDMLLEGGIQDPRYNSPGEQAQEKQGQQGVNRSADSWAEDPRLGFRLNVLRRRAGSAGGVRGRLPPGGKCR